MKTRGAHFISLLVLALCVCSPRVHAQPLQVSLSADYFFQQQPPPISGSHLSIQFAVPSLPSANFFTESTNAWGFHNLLMSLSIDATSLLRSDTQVSWFNYEDTSYRGIDIRLSSVFEANDYLQVLVPTSVSLFSGPVESPTLTMLDLQGFVGGAMHYYPDGAMAPLSADLFNTAYSVTPVPEPSTFALIVLGGLVMLVGRKHRHTSAA